MSGLTSARVRHLVERVRVTTRDQIIAVTLRKTAENQDRIATVLGHPAPIARYVDGQLGKALDSVSDHGFTLTRFSLFETVIDQAFELLIAASPYGPDKDGHYRNDHWLFVNGTRRDTGTGGKIAIGPSDVVVFINMRAYARKIEGGGRNRRGAAGGGHAKQRRPGLSVQAPDGVYEISALALRRRFGNVASINFVYRGLMGSSRPAHSGRAASRYPAIEITAKVG